MGFTQNNYTYLIGLILLVISGCIGEDIVDDRVPEVLRINNAIDSLEIGISYQLEATYLNEVGKIEITDLVWVSSDESVMSISPIGLAEALTVGNVNITVSLDGRFDISDVIKINSGVSTSVINITERNGSLVKTNTYALAGDFSIIDTGNELELRLANNFIASSALPGLFLYLTNNASTNNGALEISPITTFTGSQTFILPSSVEIGDYSHVLFYCKPYSVKVGHGEFIN